MNPDSTLVKLVNPGTTLLSLWQLLVRLPFRVASLQKIPRFLVHQGHTCPETQTPPPFYTSNLN